MSENWNVLGYETLTIAATALSLVTVPTGARSFVGTLETAQVRYRSDGTAPTSTTGEILDAGSRIVLSEHEIRKMQFIRTGGTSAVLNGHYYTQEASIFT